MVIIMGIIKKSKRGLFFSAASGAILTGLLAVCAVCFYLHKTGLSLSKLMQIDGSMQTGNVVCLARDLPEGTVLTEAQLAEISVEMPEGSIENMGISFYEGKSLLLPMKKNSILSADLVYEGEEVSDDERLLNLSYVRLNEKMEAGDYVDIRISFRSGGDYILLSKKKIQDISGGTDEFGNTVNALWLQVGEEEILRLASAVVDAYYEEGCEIYALEYVNGRQKAAAVTYPVNETVQKLLKADPNVAQIAQGEVREALSQELLMELRREIVQNRDNG